VARLDYLLDRVPPHYSFYYLKIDTEGADHLVIDGGGETRVCRAKGWHQELAHSLSVLLGKYIAMFDMVSMECRPIENRRNGNTHVLYSWHSVKCLSTA
jgi:hypothetical protein